MSIRFNFDDFDAQIADALADNEQAMADFDRVFMPGSIGGVACNPTLIDLDTL